MSRTLILTESQYNILLNRIDNESFIVEDYAADVAKRMQAGGKQSQINATKCPTGYKQLTQQQVSSFTQQIKPWQDTRRGDKAYIQLSNGIVCQSFRSEKYTENKYKDVTLRQIVEAIRSAMGSVAGIAAQVLIEFLAVGPLINASAWGLLAAYDINRGISNNDWDWTNIIIDLIGVVTTGPGAKVAKTIFSGVKGGAKGSLKLLLQTLKKTNPKGFKYIYGMLKSITKWIPKITGPITKLLGAVAAKMKNTALYNGLVKLKNGFASMHKIIHEVEANLLLVAVKVGEKYTEANVVHDVVAKGVSTVSGQQHASAKH
jgi:hypothetical protein